MISVIIPIYNGEKVIRRCLSSLMRQTYTDFEVLVIDDGSSDATAKEVLSFSDSRIRLLSQKNAGVSTARNLGIENALGDYIAFVDGDDYAEPTYLQALVSLYEEGALAAVGFTNKDCCAAAQEEKPVGVYEVGATLPADFLTGELGKSIAYSCWNKLFSKKILMENDLRFPVGIKLGEDLIFVFRYLCHCRRVIYSVWEQYHYCDNSDSAVRIANDKSYDYELTFSALQCVCENGYSFDEDSLRLWCLEIMTYILQNPYVTEMKFSDFKDYLQKLKAFQVGSMSVRAEHPMGYKRKAFHWALRRRSAMWLFFFIHANRLLI